MVTGSGRCCPVGRARADNDWTYGTDGTDRTDSTGGSYLSHGSYWSYPTPLTLAQEQACPTLTNVGGASLPRVLPENDHQTPDPRACTERAESVSERFS